VHSPAVRLLESLLLPNEITPPNAPVGHPLEYRISPRISRSCFSVVGPVLSRVVLIGICIAAVAFRQLIITVT